MQQVEDLFGISEEPELFGQFIFFTRPYIRLLYFLNLIIKYIKPAVFLIYICVEGFQLVFLFDIQRIKLFEFIKLSAAACELINKRTVRLRR